MFAGYTKVVFKGYKIILDCETLEYNIGTPINFKAPNKYKSRLIKFHLCICTQLALLVKYVFEQGVLGCTYWSPSLTC